MRISRFQRLGTVNADRRDSEMLGGEEKGTEGRRQSPVNSPCLDATKAPGISQALCHVPEK
jgi:hypothetical protein